MSESSTAAGTWYFETSVVALDYGKPACQMGFYLPGQPGTAQKPSPNQCKNIFSTMQWEATNWDHKWDGATIDLKVNPATAAHQYSLPNASGTGEAVNTGYPSYILFIQKNLGPQTQGYADQNDPFLDINLNQGNPS
ncbi:hypothetical protein MMC28_008119 [Mycoblastus sanguinarius]|nr:hypothetical protein [Mycoblastus sanguinarius]